MIIDLKISEMLQPSQSHNHCVLPFQIVKTLKVVESRTMSYFSIILLFHYSIFFYFLFHFFNLILFCTL